MWITRKLRRTSFRKLVFFISRDNTQIYMIILTMCLFEIGLWIYCDEPTRVYSSSHTRTLAGLNIFANNSDKETIGSNLTNRIWNFEDVEDIEKLYLYEKLLKKEHCFNGTNIKAFRNELQLSMEKYLYNYLIIDQQNTPENHTFKFGTRKKSPKVKISEDIHKSLPRHSRYESIPRCSVVGNSGAILHSRCGKDVDKADFVFRYGNFSKPRGVLRFVRDMRQYQGLIWAPCFSSSSMELCLDIMKTYTLEENKFVLGHPDHFQKVQKFWESRGHKGRISTGFYIVNVALSRCREVHLYGFWPFSKMADRSIKEVQYHYFDQINFTTFSNPRQHNMNSEFSVLLQLHLLGVLQIHVGECHH